MGNWIQKADIHKGGLHEALGVPMGKKIPAKKKKWAATQPGKLGKMGRLAETFARMTRA